MNKKKYYEEMLEILSHPGETLKEEIDERIMKQAELARRCGVSEKHISSIISGEKDISVSFAKKLEYVLDIDSRFWLNLQMNYNIEYFEIIEKTTIKTDELNELSKPRFQKIITWLIDRGYIEKPDDDISLTFSLREFLGVGNLSYIQDLKYEGAFRLHTAEEIDIPTLTAWLKACEVSAKAEGVKSDFDVDRLIQNLKNIRMLMHSKNPNVMITELKKIFFKCGIGFAVIEDFEGAPIHGYLKKDNESILLGTTIKGGYTDIFWFTLFHEIAHVVSEDFKESLVDFKSVDTARENKANQFARDWLIDRKSYNEYIVTGDFSKETILRFSSDNNILSSILIGRLQKDGHILKGKFNSIRKKIVWKS